MERQPTGAERETSPCLVALMADDALTVRALLAIANLEATADEEERFVRIFPVLRAHADALYAEEFSDEEPATRFDPTTAFVS